MTKVHDHVVKEYGKFEKEVSEQKQNNSVLEKENTFLDKNCLKLEETLFKAPPSSETILNKYDKEFQKFLNKSLNRSKMDSMIYNISHKGRR